MAAERGPLETRDRLGLETRDLNNPETPVAAERGLQPETRDGLELETPEAAAGAQFVQRKPTQFCPLLPIANRLLTRNGHIDDYTIPDYVDEGPVDTDEDRDVGLVDSEIESEFGDNVYINSTSSDSDDPRKSAEIKS